MTYKIVDIQGIGPEFSEKLKSINVHTTEDLLKVATDEKAFGTLSQKTGISEKLFETWTGMARLMQVDGIGPQYAELLYHAGVDSVETLRKQPVDALLRKLGEVNATRNLSNALPHVTDVRKWMENIQDAPVLTAR